jgi:hypothetical protein
LVHTGQSSTYNTSSLAGVTLCSIVIIAATSLIKK